MSAPNLVGLQFGPRNSENHSVERIEPLKKRRTKFVESSITVLSKFGTMVSCGFVVKAKNDWLDGRPQVAMQH